jgi:hypothetical protein
MNIDTNIPIPPLGGHKHGNKVSKWIDLLGQMEPRRDSVVIKRKDLHSIWNGARSRNMKITNRSIDVENIRVWRLT